MAGSALTATASAEHEAAGELERAMGLYDRGPGEREEYWFVGQPLAGIDLAVVRLRSGALDAAAVALQPALSLAAGQRISEVTIRLGAVRDERASFGSSSKPRSPGSEREPPTCLRVRAMSVLREISRVLVSEGGLEGAGHLLPQADTPRDCRRQRQP